MTCHCEERSDEAISNVGEEIATASTRGGAPLREYSRGRRGGASPPAAVRNDT